MNRSLAPLLMLLAGCAAPRPPVDDVLAPRQETTGGAREEARSAAPHASRLGRVDAAAAERRARARDDRADARAWLDASVALFHASELRAELSLREAVAESDPEDLAELLALEEALREPWRSEMAALAKEGAALAERALELEGSSLYAALHLATTARTQGFLSSLISGLGPRLDEATRAAAESSPTYEDGGALVLRGSFLLQAPWPYGDGAAALEVLRRAADVGPTLPGLLALGDALHAAGRRDEARATWRRAADAEPAPPDDPLAPLQRERAAWRLELTEP